MTGRPGIAICVPVHNERVLLPRLLDALRAQDAIQLWRPTICLFLDGCTDDSAEAAARGAHGLVLSCRAGPVRADANAGRARREAMALGLAAVGDAPGALLLATDADSVPAPDWMVRAAAALSACDVVAGLIEREEPERYPVQSRIEAYYDRLYAYRRDVDPVPWEPATGHHYTGGANLGFRAEAYRLLGGFAPLPSGEDAAIVDEAHRAGLRVRRDGTVAVRTSARRHGRAPGGLAAALRQGDGGGRTGVSVGHPEAAAWQYARHALARARFPRLPERGAAAEIGLALGLSADHVIGVARDAPNAEAFATRIVPAAPNAEAQVPLAEAERALAMLESLLLGRAA